MSSSYHISPQYHAIPNYAALHPIVSIYLLSYIAHDVPISVGGLFSRRNVPRSARSAGGLVYGETLLYSSYGGFHQSMEIRGS